MNFYRKKPVVVQAVQYKLDATNQQELKDFCPALQLFAIDDDGAEYNLLNPRVQTSEGVMMLSPGDWLIKGVKGEFYPCKPDVFALTYDHVGIA